jgi:hypothetical protein
MQLCDENLEVSPPYDAIETVNIFLGNLVEHNKFQLLNLRNIESLYIEHRELKFISVLYLRHFG